MFYSELELLIIINNNLKNLYNNAVILESLNRDFYHIAQKLLSHEETKAYYDNLQIDKYLEKELRNYLLNI